MSNIIRNIILSVLSVTYIVTGLFLMIFDIYFLSLIIIGLINFVSIFRNKPNKLTILLYGSQTFLIFVSFILMFVGSSIVEIVYSFLFILIPIIAFGYLYLYELKVYKIKSLD